MNKNRNINSDMIIVKNMCLPEMYMLVILIVKK